MNIPVRYDRHEAEWQEVLTNEERKSLGESWLREGTIDRWRHQRMLELLTPFVDQCRGDSWLTVGDGRYGSDAHQLISMGALNVHASDLSDTLLKIGAQKGFIHAFSAQNAEALSFGDDAFDYVLCKEALHHFPRPWLALYEMLRVARKAIILMEPRDIFLESSHLEGILRKITRKSICKHSFEPVGNYVYGISEHEIEKFLLGMHLTNCAFAGMNDAYEFGVEFVPVEGGTSSDWIKRIRIKSKIGMLNALARLSIRCSNKLLAVLFAEEPDRSLVSRIEAAGWRYRNLPKNPFLNVRPESVPARDGRRLAAAMSGGEDDHPVGGEASGRILRWYREARLERASRRSRPGQPFAGRGGTA